MTREERATQIDLANRLGEQGYATYAKLFMLFELRLTSDPRAIGYMEPGKGRITLNRTIEPHQMLLTIRHEILHEYLSHELRLLEHLAEKYPELDGDEVSLKDILYKDDTFNYAADYEISNRGYTEQDKQDIRHIKFNGQIVSGLVTEDKHPDWIDMSVEEMYDLLQDEKDAQQNQQQNGGQSADNQDEQQGDGEGQGGQSQSQDSDSGQSDSDGSGESGDDSNDGSGDESGEQDKGDSDDSGKSGGDSGGSSQADKDSGASDSDKGQGGSNDGNQGNSKGSGGDNKKVRIIRGTMRDGKFYDLNGNEIRPGG